MAVHLLPCTGSMPSLSTNFCLKMIPMPDQHYLFKGGKSGYLRVYFSQIMDFFPAAKIDTIPEAGMMFMWRIGQVLV